MILLAFGYYDFIWEGLICSFIAAFHHRFSWGECGVMHYRLPW